MRYNYMEIIKKKGSKNMKQENQNQNQEQNQNQKQEPEELISTPEIEGGNWFYYWVCSECHGIIVWNQERCKWCKRRIDWNG